MRRLWYALLLFIAVPVLGNEQEHPLLPADTSSPRATLNSFNENCTTAYHLLKASGRDMKDDEAKRSVRYFN